MMAKLQVLITNNYNNIKRLNMKILLDKKISKCTTPEKKI